MYWYAWCFVYSSRPTSNNDDEHFGFDELVLLLRSCPVRSERADERYVCGLTPSGLVAVS